MQLSLAKQDRRKSIDERSSIIGQVVYIHSCCHLHRSFSTIQKTRNTIITPLDLSLVLALVDLKNYRQLAFLLV